MILTGISLLIMTWTVLADGISYEACDVYDGEHGIPVGSHRTCSVFQDNQNSCNDDSPYFHRRTTGGCFYLKAACETSCFGFVGMNLTYECSFEGARLYRYKNGVHQYLSGSSVNYGLLLPEHAGLYQCRNSSDYTVHTQNITVNEEVRIGSVNSRCTDFGRDVSHDCCKASSSWPVAVSTSYRHYTVYGDPADVTVTVEQLEWLVEKETRNDVDIGLYTERDETNPVIWKIMAKKIPLYVTKLNPRILFRVTANSRISSHTICDTAVFNSGSHDLEIINTSLPENTTISEGEDALFQCSFSYSTYTWNIAAEIIIGVEVKTPIVEGNKTTYSFCSGWYALAWTEKNNTNCSSTKVTSETEIVGVATNVLFTIRMSQVTATLTGTTVTCLLIYTKYDYNPNLQWKREAHLTVIEGYLPQTTSIVTSLSVAIVLVAMVVLLAVGGTTIVVMIWRRRRNYHLVIDLDEVSLKTNDENSSNSSSECFDQPSGWPLFEPYKHDAAVALPMNSCSTPPLPLATPSSTVI